MPKLRFGLRTLLFLPICVAAFYLGWNAHESYRRVLQSRDDVLARQRRTDLLRELVLHREIKADMLRSSVNRIEHLERMKSYDRFLNDPIGAKMHPEGSL